MESILSGHDGERNDASKDFDTLFDTKALRILQVLIPFFPAAYQPLLAVWIRFAQLKHALSLINSKSFTGSMANTSASKGDQLAQMLSALKPCLSDSEYQQLERMQNLFSMYQRLQEWMPLLSALSGMPDDLSAADLGNAFSAMQGEKNGENNSAFDAAGIMNAFSAMQGAKNTGNDSAPAADLGSGMDLETIMNLVSLFQSSSGSADAADDHPDTSEIQEETTHEQRLDE